MRESGCNEGVTMVCLGDEKVIGLKMVLQAGGL